MFAARSVRFMEGDATPSGVRLAELVAALSLATDLGLGQPQEHVLRQTLIARRVADAAGFEDWQRSAVFYVSLLAWVGCISDSHELARWFGDDRQFRADSYQVDMAGSPLKRFVLGHVGLGSPPLRRLTMIGRFLTAGVGPAPLMAAHCETTAAFADRLQLDGDVRGALRQAFERWDGRGVPGTHAGSSIDPVMRVVHIADAAEVFHRLEGIDGAVAMVRSRRGTEFDPHLVDVFCDNATSVLGDLDELDVWDEVVRGDDALATELTEAELTLALQAFGDYADLKCPAWLGHSRGVADLARSAAGHLDLPTSDVTLIERAALVHDLGSLGISTGVWDKTARLAVADQERMRTHAYLTERVLARSPKLAEIGAVAGLHHERLDGSGYPKGVTADALPVTARLVAVADVYHALTEDRPHRRACTPVDAAAVVRQEVRDGRLDTDAARAVLTAAGHRVRKRPSLPAGLTAREVEVLVLLARGRTNKEIASALSVTPKTVGTHVEHVYSKLQVSTRGAAAMFAMRHGLVGSEG